MENKVIAKEYVEKNYIHKDILINMLSSIEFELQQREVDMDDYEECYYEDCQDLYYERKLLKRILKKWNI